jgi:hypothetical protein
MLIFSFIIAIVLVENVLGAINRGQYIELDNTKTEAYLCIEEDNCNVVYICKKRKEILFADELSDCYNRNEHTTMIFVPNNRDDPDDCDIKGYANIKSDKCYFTSDRSGDASYNQPIEFNRVRYYDRVVYQDPNSQTNVEMALTEYGWCTIARDNEDTTWIEKLPDDIQINQINIPGTHDSGTYAIGDTGFNFSLYPRRLWSHSRGKYL